ncbi:RelA/SpoT family protein [Pseudoclavibacter sp. 13-3]|uniref:RelA/SpoT family protein n=1 Tax=Pseudoclavibacter sp. 13-3 TaxID=2901228 RepID=UPI001E2E2517|nr:bifunctional (p)ppGpp synthetase/guanosine-3',5'-bis(diphosphate) 3'-pyrophosphohydrolase [Pseudoclavibacter sp. 13-3]MCD7102020.1 bifunctional (p)ppGpp synthetase/guanosine-3',5'-bis(diphosphate) 3'-pyrophosphohydrolase [Pseudoclavibacter sp. 13-3]
MPEQQQSTPSAPRRLGLPRLFQRPATGLDAQVSQLVQTVRHHHPKEDLALVRRAYATAYAAHDGQLRQSGEPYITHPIAVAQILADLGVTAQVVAAALLHDTVEDTAYTLDQLTADYGAEIAMLVDGVTKLDKVKYGANAQAETVRKMVVAMARDVRVIVIKLADRLHNARTWGFVPPEKAARKAKETLEIYAPLAHRLGLSALQHELEDRSFKALYPKVYDEIVRLVKERTPARESYVKRVISMVDDDLRRQRIKAEVVGRSKDYYSVYQKMVVRGREFDEIYDLVGIRILVNSIRDCYAALGAIHARWSPIPGRFKDYIAIPKFNLYQSLHTSVIGPDGRPVEIQIRTYEMHQRAEYGVAAHWLYKASGAKPMMNQAAEQGINQELIWLQHLSDWQSETKDPGEFLDSLRFEIGAKEVYVFTPQGKVVGLPGGATPIDFAYAVHTEVGHRAMGAKVNGRLVPLDTRLASGEVVEILTSRSADAGPSKDWLSFVTSPRARAKIRQWFSKERRDESIEAGKEALQRALRKNRVPLRVIGDQQAFTRVASGLGYPNIGALYAALGEGHVSTQSVIERIELDEFDETTGELPIMAHPHPTTHQRSGSSDSGVLVRGQSGVMVKLAKCCTPVPGDDIVGFITRGAGVSVHRADCRNVTDLNEKQHDRMVEVSWAPTHKSVFLVNIQVEALDRSGLLSDVTRVLSEHHVNILSASVKTSDDRLALSRFVFEMGDTVHLDRILNAVRRIDAVYDVYRVNG